MAAQACSPSTWSRGRRIPGLQSELQESQEYTEKTYLKKQRERQRQRDGERRKQPSRLCLPCSEVLGALGLKFKEVSAALAHPSPGHQLFCSLNPATVLCLRAFALPVLPLGSVPFLDHPSLLLLHCTLCFPVKSKLFPPIQKKGWHMDGMLTTKFILGEREDMQQLRPQR